MLHRTVSISEVARVIHHLPPEYTFFHGQETAQSKAYRCAASMNGKLGDIRDIAPFVRFLVTEGWWINGQTVFANGGLRRVVGVYPQPPAGTQPASCRSYITLVEGLLEVLQPT